MKPNIMKNIKNYVKIGMTIMLFLVMEISMMCVPVESTSDKWHIRSIYAKKYKKRIGNGDDN